MRKVFIIYDKLINDHCLLSFVFCCDLLGVTVANAVVRIEIGVQASYSILSSNMAFAKELL